jgi:hypothetical protein
MAGRDMQREQLRWNVTNHPPTDPRVTEALEAMAAATIALGDAIIDRVPVGREQSLALTNLEQTVMWARAGIARNQDEVTG